MVLSKLLRAFGLFVLVILAVLGFVGYKLYSTVSEHSEFEVGWAVSDPEREPEP